MTIYTIGFTKKSAETFFTLIRENNIDLLVDIRLNNKSQLAGFAKGDDLRYFLAKLCNCDYEHCKEFAPTKDILQEYQNQNISWTEYENKYNDLMIDRGDYMEFANRFMAYQRIVLLCSELTAEQCHRRLFAEMLCKVNPNLSIYHI